MVGRLPPATSKVEWEWQGGRVAPIGWPGDEYSLPDFGCVYSHKRTILVR